MLTAHAQGKLTNEDSVEASLPHSTNRVVVTHTPSRSPSIQSISDVDTPPRVGDVHNEAKEHKQEKKGEEIDQADSVSVSAERQHEHTENHSKLGGAAHVEMDDLSDACVDSEGENVDDIDLSSEEEGESDSELSRQFSAVQERLKAMGLPVVRRPSTHSDTQHSDGGEPQRSSPSRALSSITTSTQTESEVKTHYIPVSTTEPDQPDEVEGKEVTEQTEHTNQIEQRPLTERERRKERILAERRAYFEQRRKRHRVAYEMQKAAKAAEAKQ